MGHQLGKVQQKENEEVNHEYENVMQDLPIADKNTQADRMKDAKRKSDMA